MGNPTSRRLAEWRRRGKGVWQITLVIYGDDEVYTLLLPGEMKQKDAETLARMELRDSENTARKHVHVSAVELLP